MERKAAGAKFIAVAGYAIFIENIPLLLAGTKKSGSQTAYKNSGDRRSLKHFISIVPKTTKFKGVGKAARVEIRYGKEYVTPVVNWNEFFLNPGGGSFSSVSSMLTFRLVRL